MKLKVKFEHVSKTYKLYKKSSDKLLDLFSVDKKRTETFYALKDISFEVFEGETVGIIGINGSGKSTLSNLLSGSVPHTSGSMAINGEPSLIAISAGLDKNLSGIDNIEQKCLMHGLKSNEIKQIKQDIINFAELGDFINQPVKNYSSGMKSRLGFAISIHTNPDILIIDEALSAGDQTFYQKCVDRINQFKKEGKTIFFVSHSISQIRSISDRVIWIHFGKVKEIGEAAPVLKNYNDFIKWFNKLSPEEQKDYKSNMMEEQKNQYRTEDLEIGQSRRSKKAKSEVSGNIRFILQIGFLFLITLIGGSLLVLNESIANINLPLLNKPNTEIKQTESEETFKPIGMNEKGVIVKDRTPVYDSVDKTGSPVDHLPFPLQIDVKEETETMYKIIYNGSSHYVNKESIQITSIDSLPVEDATIETFEELYPNSFFQSYEFFTAFFNADYPSLKEKLRGYEEKTNAQGNKVLYLDEYGISYVFSNKDVANEIIINNVNNETSNINEFTRISTLSSKDNRLYFVKTEKYHFVLNLEENTISIKVNE